MPFDLGEWLNLAIRWLHLVAGIAWIGSSFYFVWLDNHLKAPATGDASGELWSVHGGGFYHNQKYQVAPSEMPERLHWFKWEAYFTWISGFSLLILIYYVGANNFLVDPGKAALSPAAAIAIGLASLAIGWLVYDLLCRSPVGSSNLALGIFWFVCLLFAAKLLDSLFSARAAYMHVGAIIGTVMVANVFFIIIPNQRKVVADLVAGRTPDPALGQAAKQRSLHNNYMTLPVLFIMISPHYPMTYGAGRPWLVLALLGLTGVAVRHVFNRRGRGQSTAPAIVLAIALAVASVTYVTLEKGGAAAGPAQAVAYAEIEPILATHCAACHNVPRPPLGVRLDSWEHVRAASARIRRVTVDSQAMPLGNPTRMTPAEREKLGGWIAAGSPR
ncbi:MAG TPA: urate hydroxylase PuuD [Allosphingosinicella sp.]|nr:urate hydroxylase PuuD [Allosphingosinicella sp.]